MAAYAEEQAKIKELVDKIEKGVKDVFESDRFKKYLTVMSRFYHYSLNNQILIWLQNPNATRVAGFTVWQKKFQRSVKRGEHGMTIFAPVPVKRKQKETVIDADGNEETVEKERTDIKYRRAFVFDLAQTDGKPLPELAAPLKGAVKDYDLLYKKLCQIAPVPVFEENLHGGVHGCFSPSEQKIVLNQGGSELQKIKTLIHEIAHSILHQNPTEKDRETKETEAEGIAFTVSSYLGLDTSAYSFDYLAGWASSKELKELKSSLETISQTAKKMIDAMENDEKVPELQKAQPEKEYEERFHENPQDGYCIYQLPNTEANATKVFTAYNELKEPPVKEDYSPVYSGTIKKGDKDVLLEELFNQFNVNHPTDYTARSLSISDVVALKQDGTVTYYYCDRCGFKELPHFTLPPKVQEDRQKRNFHKKGLKRHHTQER